MKKFLVIGCGGSGAKTQAYMMDQLKAQLRAKGWDKKKLPQAWQFVSVDVPITPEAGPSNLPNVPNAGGSYVGIGTTQQYRSFDSGVSETLGAKGELGEIATWAPRNPETIATPISAGAGQYRALGRMLTIPALRKIRQTLAEAVEDMHEGSAELDELAEMVSGRRQHSDDESPIVIVVSSMAGGAGASMFLDVCRLLATVPGVNTSDVGVFMYTPEVFEKVDQSAMVGAWPNSLAVFGEAFATQTGAANESDRKLFNAMGIQGTDSPFTFGRIFPIGARMGANGTVFGDGNPSTIYRGMGRSLAALMFSEQASASFHGYALANTGSIDANRSILGWANNSNLPWDRLPWGTWGYSQLSMGRDRYAEYSAQRLARLSFDRLLRGHLDSTSTLSGQEQMRQRLDERLSDIAQNSLYLDPNFLNSEPSFDHVMNWLLQIFSSFGAPAVNDAKATLRSNLPEGDGRKGREFQPLIRGKLRDPGLAQHISSELDRQAYKAVYEFANMITNEFTAMAERQVADLGVPFVQQVLERLRDTLSNRVVRVLQQVEGRAQRDRVLADPMGLDEKLQPLTGNNTVKGSAQMLDEVTDLYHSQINGHFYFLVGKHLRPVLEDFSINVIKRLHEELNKSHQVLERADKDRDFTLNLADVASNDPNAWPRETDERINDRFHGSHNEILITEVERFPEDFVNQLEETVKASKPEVADYPQASRAAARSVISGQWDTQGSQLSPRDTLAAAVTDVPQGANRVFWVCKHLVSPPDGGETREPRPARFDVKLSPEDLLERARTWVNRPNYEFANFINADLRSYLKDETVGEVEIGNRMTRLRRAFRKAMDQARPLAAVHSDTLRAVYNRDIEYQYSFSEIPFKDMEAADALKKEIEDRNNLTRNTHDAFETSLAQDDKIQSIDVFGSYPNYSPIVFSSVFDPIGKEWARRKSNPEGFWKLRRTRPLAGALPMSDDERRAMVAGWIIGVATGRVYVSDQGQANAAAHVWHEEKQAWVGFPNPMLTPPTAMQSSIDWMAAVIESVLVAFASVQERNQSGAVGESLLPYRLLRSIYDNKPDQKTTGGGVEHPVVKRLAEFLKNGERPSQSAIGSDIEERYEYLEQNLARAMKTAQAFIDNRAAALPGSQVEEKPWARVTDRAYAKNMPYYRDLAPDVVEVVSELRKHLEDAKRRATQPAPSSLPGQNPDPAADFGPPAGGPSFDSDGGLI